MLKCDVCAKELVEGEELYMDGEPICEDCFADSDADKIYCDNCGEEKEDNGEDYCDDCIAEEEDVDEAMAEFQNGISILIARDLDPRDYFQIVYDQETFHKN